MCMTMCLILHFYRSVAGHCAPSGLNNFSYNVLCVSFKQNEENKKKNKQAALKAQMDLEEARKAASQTAEQQNNNASQEDQEGETFYGWSAWTFIMR